MCLELSRWFFGRLRRQASSHSLDWVHLGEIGWLVGRLRRQASSHRFERGTFGRDWLAGRPPSRASSLPQKSKSRSRSRSRSAYHPRPSPLNRPSVSSPAALDLPAPSGGRVEVFIWGWARSAVRRSRTHREEVVAKQTVGDAPR